jgi:hypothetical protein
MTTEWAQLPNAKYIDLVLADLKANPDHWTRARDAAWHIIPIAVRVSAKDTVWSSNRTYRRAAKDATWEAASQHAVDGNIDPNAFQHNWAAARAASWDATLALIAYDDCAYLLNAKIEYVQMIALLGNPAAIMLYPACIALNLVDR